MVVNGMIFLNKLENPFLNFYLYLKLMKPNVLLSVKTKVNCKCYYRAQKII